MAKMYHIVLVKFSPAKTHRAAELLAALGALRKWLPGFLSVTGGPYSSAEGLNQGYTHGYVMTFASGMVRDQYLVHPEHDKIKEAFLPDL